LKKSIEKEEIDYFDNAWMFNQEKISLLECRQATSVDRTRTNLLTHRFIIIATTQSFYIKDHSNSISFSTLM
jgi:hypothetical protein